MDIAAQELNRVRGPFACGAADEAPWGAIWSRFHRRTDAMALSASNAIAATTVPQAVECDAVGSDPDTTPQSGSWTV